MDERLSAPVPLCLLPTASLPPVRPSPANTQAANEQCLSPFARLYYSRSPPSYRHYQLNAHEPTAAFLHRVKVVSVRSLSPPRSRTTSLYSKCDEMNMAELLFRKIKIMNEISWTLMMTGYVRCGQIEIAMEIFNKMPSKDIASWNALITIIAQNNHSVEALNIFEAIVRMKVTPNSLTLVSTLSYCAKIGALDLRKWIHFYIKQNKFEIDAKKDLLVWSTIIRGLAMHGQSKLTLEFFEQTKGYGIQPDAITFLGVLSACSHAGLLEEGYYYFNEMTKVYGISPTIEHSSCMVDLLGRHDLLQEANDFISRMVITLKSEAIWGALLGACKLHGDS